MIPVLLRWLAGPALAESIIGDIQEQRRQRSARSRSLATLWFWRRTVAIMLYFFALRASAAVVHASGGVGGDVRYAVRTLGRAPAYAATVIGVIALGMSLAITVFAVVDGVLFKPLPYPDADRLVAIEPGFNNLPAITREEPSWLAKVPRGQSASVRDVADWQAAAPEVLITGFRASNQSGMGEGVNETSFGIGFVQANFFDTIGVGPLMGGLSAADFDHEDIVRPVVISHELWQGRFLGAGDVIGRTYIDDPVTGRGFRVAGVMPRGFVFPSARVSVSFIAPYVPTSDVARDPSRRTVGEVIARLPAGMPPTAFRERVEAGMSATAAVFPIRTRPPGWSDRGWRTQGPFDHADVVPLSSKLGQAERPLFAAIFLAALVLLTLGGLNVSALMAARGLDRAPELGLRRALGASGHRIARLVFLEALMAVAVASAIGLGLAVLFLHIGIRLLPEEVVLLQSHITPVIDGRVAAFVALTALALVVPTTVWPIRRALRTGAAPLEAGRGSTQTRSLGRTLVVATQIAGALVLTMGGGLLVTSIMAVYANVPPIRTDDIVVLREEMREPSRFLTIGAPDRTARANALIDTLRRVPGVDDVALTEGQVLEGGGGVPWWRAPAEFRGSRIDVVAQAVSPDFYRVLQPQLVMGRFPTDAESSSTAPVIVVSELVARTYWPSVSPLGQTLTFAPTNTPFTVVGVVKDVRWNYWDIAVGAVYGPFGLASRSSGVTVFIRTRKSADEITAEAMSAVAAFDPLARTTQSGTFHEFFADTVRPRRFKSWLFGSFAVAALVIVGTGILGLIAMSTARRTREMGIRLALGSTRESLVRLLLREQFVSVALGVLAGSLISAWAVRFVRAYLYEVTPYDPRVWALAIVVIVLTSAAGTLFPALRASRTDPVRALRAD